MTIVAGLAVNGRVYMAADSQASSGWDCRNRKDPKVFISHDILYGFTSSYRMGQILRYHTEPLDIPSAPGDIMGFVVRTMVPQWRRLFQDHGYLKSDAGRDDSGTFMAGLRGKLFTVDSDFQVAEHTDNFAAVGCGSAYALGAMEVSYTDNNISDAECEYIVTQAVSVACKFSNGCGGEIVCLSN